MPPKPQSLSSIELFSGAGGLALGVKRAGFEHRMLVEYNRHACATLRENAQFFGSMCNIVEADVRKLDFRPHAGVDLLAAGAPCQPFSIGGKHRAHADDRNLFPQVFRAQREIRPRAVLVENVKGLLRPALSDFVEYIELQLAFPDCLPRDPVDPEVWQTHLRALRRHARSEEGSASDYVVQHVLLNAANYGVPQKRERVFFIAIRRDFASSWHAPLSTHSEAALRLSTEVTGEYWKRHGMRREVARDAAIAEKLSFAAGGTLPWRTVRDAINDLPLPQLAAATSEIPNHVRQPGARSYPGHTGSSYDAPAKTLKAGVHGVPGGENMLRMNNGSVRYFTVREAARLQTFPDNYRFAGAWSEAMRQIGNAVPVELAHVVAKTIADALLSRAHVKRGFRHATSQAHDRVAQGDLLLPSFAR
ncbi:MAG: DNA cytosine methyltransferase [Gemmatimonadetes bacterium]|nr:DNA cytosine methyltransferase [Gemmatimonadota bacterium]